MMEQSLFPELEPSVRPISAERKAAFGKCGDVLEMLIRQGKQEDVARRILGGWIKRAGGDADAVIRAAEAAKRAGAVDVAGYIYGCFANGTKERARQKEGAARVAALLSAR